VLTTQDLGVKTLPSSGITISAAFTVSVSISTTVGAAPIQKSAQDPVVGPELAQTTCCSCGLSGPKGCVTQ
jgi:hypothetical protein